jgi:hypothetical protein
MSIMNSNFRKSPLLLLGSVALLALGLSACQRVNFQMADIKAPAKDEVPAYTFDVESAEKRHIPGNQR